MKAGPLFSVIIPTYNRKELVLRAIASVLDQTLADFEIIVIDDASTEDIESAVTKMSDSRIRYYRNPSNTGVASSRNRGIELSKGELISFLDSDDFYLPVFLERSAEKMRSAGSDVGFIWTGYKIMDDNGDIVSTATWRPAKTADPYHQFLSGLGIGTGCGLTFRREVLNKVRFNQELRSAEDTEFFLRLAREFHFEFIDDPLIVIHKHGGERITQNYHHALQTYLVIFETHSAAITKSRNLRMKYFEKIMTLAYKSGNMRIARLFFGRSLPESLLVPRILAKSIYFEWKNIL